jgi:hypothetical protein
MQSLANERGLVGAPDQTDHTAGTEIREAGIVPCPSSSPLSRFPLGEHGGFPWWSHPCRQSSRLQAEPQIPQIGSKLTTKIIGDKKN